LFSFNGQTFQYQGEGVWKKIVQFKRGFTYEPQTEVVKMKMLYIFL